MTKLVGFSYAVPFRAENSNVLLLSHRDVKEKNRWDESDIFECRLIRMFEDLKLSSFSSFMGGEGEVARHIEMTCKPELYGEAFKEFEQFLVQNAIWAVGGTFEERTET